MLLVCLLKSLVYLWLFSAPCKIVQNILFRVCSFIHSNKFIIKCFSVSLGNMNLLRQSFSSSMLMSQRPFFLVGQIVKISVEKYFLVVFVSHPVYTGRDATKDNRTQYNSTFCPHWMHRNKCLVFNGSRHVTHVRCSQGDKRCLLVLKVNAHESDVMWLLSC